MDRSLPQAVGGLKYLSGAKKHRRAVFVALKDRNTETDFFLIEEIESQLL